MADTDLPAALAFDVFGTIVDWRSGIARQSSDFLSAIGRNDLDSNTFADRWRARYMPAMAAVRDGRRGFVLLDTLHREMLVDLLESEGVDAATLAPALLDDWAHAWHRLDPWPDAVQGLLRLKTRFPIVTLSNGNVSLILDMARRAAALGRDPRRRVHPRLQARSRCLSRHRGCAGDRTGPALPSRRASQRSRGSTIVRAAHRLCRAADGIWRSPRPRCGRGAGVGLVGRRAGCPRRPVRLLI